MDWILENKWKSILIVALLVLNIVTILIIWVQPLRRPGDIPAKADQRVPESASVMKSALDLTDEQTTQFTRMLADYHEQTRPYNDRLTVLKRGLVDALFADAGDSSRAVAMAKEIGETQAKIEGLRFQHFQKFLALCTPDQKEKLKPILMELFGRRPPREEPRVASEPEKSDRSAPAQYKTQKSISPGGKPTPREEADRPAPPALDEKLSRYATRLALNNDQKEKVRAVMEESRKKGEQLRNSKNPDPHEIDVEKEKIREAEDQGIKKILDEQQRKIFEDMISKRGQDRR